MCLIPFAIRVFFFLGISVLRFSELPDWEEIVWHQLWKQTDVPPQLCDSGSEFLKESEFQTTAMMTP